jgi:hypothetical protein
MIRGFAFHREAQLEPIGTKHKGGHYRNTRTGARYGRHK